MRLDVYLHFVGGFDEVNQKLDRLLTKETQMADLGADILAKVTEARAGVDSVLALLAGLQAAGTITQATHDAIISAIQGQEDAVNAALNANPAPPTP